MLSRGLFVVPIRLRSVAWIGREDPPEVVVPRGRHKAVARIGGQEQGAELGRRAAAERVRRSRDERPAKLPETLPALAARGVERVEVRTDRRIDAVHARAPNAGRRCRELDPWKVRLEGDALVALGSVEQRLVNKKDVGFRAASVAGSLSGPGQVCW